jgi:hypothetical protein
MSERDDLARLRRLDPLRPDADRAGDSAWASSAREAILAGRPPAVRRGRSRRALGAAITASALAGITALVVALIAVGGQGGAPASTPTRTLLFQAEPPTAGAVVTPAALSTTAHRLTVRADRLGLSGFRATPSGPRRISLTVPTDLPADALRQLVARGVFRLTSYEGSVLGAPVRSRARAVRDGRRLLGLPMATTVPPGTVLARQKVQILGGTPGTATSWVLMRADRPAIGNAGLASATASTGSRPLVQVSFTPTAQRTFTLITRRAARDGQIRQKLQHLAVLLDGTLVSLPSVDWRAYPVGIDGRNGIEVDLDPDGAPRIVAAVLDSGPLPLSLHAVGQP